MKLKRINPSFFLRSRFRKKPLYFAAFGVALIFLFGLSVLVLPNTVYAGGGVGSGGGGGGGAPPGSDHYHYTSYGWGWTTYDVNGLGPTDGFKNGINWADVQSTCRSAGARTVYAHIIADRLGDGMVYDYLYSQVYPYEYPGQFTAGTIVDNGRAIAIDIPTAQAAFNSLPGYGVDTSGFTFGVNVAWFCYDYAPPIPSTATVQAHVFFVDTVGNKLGDFGGATLTTCVPSQPNIPTDGNGYATMGVAAGTGFCLRVNNPPPAGYDGPFVRPWGEHYDYADYTNNYLPQCGSYTAYRGYGGPPYAGHCDQSTYEWQVAGRFDGWRQVWPNPNTWVYDRNWDGGYDFVYVKRNPVVQAHVFKMNSDGSGIVDMPGVAIRTCTNPGTLTTDGNGYATMTLIPGTGFCLEPQGGAPPGYSGPYIRPYLEGYNNYGTPKPCPGFGGLPSNPLYCTDTSYQWQIAGLDAKTVPGFPAEFNTRDRASDTGYDFVYVRAPQVDVCPNLPGSQGIVPAGYTKDTSGNCVQPDNPYMRVYGNDVLAGGGFGNCTPSATARIIGYNDGGGRGAATQFAAQAMGAITGFTSATLRAASPTAPKGLSFSNTAGDTTYGGNFGTAPCAADFFADASNVQPNYQQAALNVANSQHVVIYASGDVRVNGNVIYSGAGAWANLSDIPSYYLIVKGNIYIQKDVTQLDGVYIAQDDGTGTKGRIYTCANAASLYAADQLYANCGSKLVINGAFIAKQVKFQRTRGSLYGPASPPYSWSGWNVMNTAPRDCGLGSTAAGNSPAVASWGIGRLDVFYRGTDNRLKHCYTNNANDNLNSGWTLEDLGGGLTSSPDAVSWGPNRIDVFARGGDNAIWHRTYEGGTWYGWESYGGCSSTGPAAASWGPGRLDVVTSGCPAPGAIYHGSWNSGPGWSGFTNNLGGATYSDQGAVSWGPNRLDIFARGTDNLLYHNAWGKYDTGGAFTGWRQEVPGRICSGPAATAPGMNQSYANRLDVFAMGCGGGLYQTTWTRAGWGPLTPIDGNPAAKADPAAVSWGDNRFDIFNFNSSGQLLWQYYDLNSRPFNAAATPGEASSSANIAEVFNYTPELFMTVSGPVLLNGPVDAITSLPPIL